MTAPRTVVRPDAKGDPDDVVLDAIDCVHLERMSSGHWWLGCYRGEERITFAITSSRRIAVAVVEDGLGARDDSADPIVLPVLE